MRAVIYIKDKEVEVDFAQGKDISIPLLFNGSQPNTYGVDKAAAKAYQDRNFIGDTRQGGPCNFETYTLTPHCNGTHTECIGHITTERIDILSSLQDELIPSSLISVTPETTNEKYIPPLDPNDLVITKKTLERQLHEINPVFLKGLIIRTLPNLIEKKEKDYMKTPPAFFSIDAMQYIVELGVKHLFVDVPSVDRLYDDGMLSAHNMFWQTQDKKKNIATQNKTITEMIFVDEQINDGYYLLNLQIAAFKTDASPSRPIIYVANGV